jgi:hypothetical protein
MVTKIKKSEHSMDNQIFLFEQLKYNVHEKKQDKAAWWSSRLLLFCAMYRRVGFIFSFSNKMN